MGKKLLFLLAGIISISLVAGVGILVATDAPDKVTLGSGFDKLRKAAVEFDHKKHVDAQLACTQCHHVYEDGKNVWKEGDPVQKCSACHDPEESKGNVKKLMLAFHTNCMGCHKEMDKAGKTTGPTRKCNDCH
ncbi:MAG: cytochrome c3 family protein [Thermodesulfobacteriota bacterium]